MCVDVETGERVWHFQAVHHGLWDYDFPTAPNLVDITVDGRRIRAVAQISKQAFIYTFDRVTGEPIWPIVERPVSTETNLPGEVVSPTQPFPTKPAPFDYQGIAIDDLVDFTPEVRKMAIEAVRDYTLGPLFTPPTLPVPGGNKGTLIRPPNVGAGGWGGAAVDPETGMLYVPSRNAAFLIPLYRPDPALGATVPYTHGAPEAERLAGNRVGVQMGPQMPQGLPLLKPPYSRMTAIDMNTGEACVDGAAGKRGSDSQPPSVAQSRPAAAGWRQRPEWAPADQDSAHQRALCWRYRRWPAARRS